MQNISTKWNRIIRTLVYSYRKKFKTFKIFGNLKAVCLFFKVTDICLEVIRANATHCKMGYIKQLKIKIKMKYF